MKNETKIDLIKATLLSNHVIDANGNVTDEPIAGTDAVDILIEIAHIIRAD